MKWSKYINDNKLVDYNNQSTSINSIDDFNKYYTTDTRFSWNTITNSIIRPTSKDVLFSGSLSFVSDMVNVLINNFNGGSLKTSIHKIEDGYQLAVQLCDDETIAKFEFVMITALYSYDETYLDLLDKK